MNNKVKILIINASYNYGGVSSVIMNYYRKLDHTLLNFTFLSPNESTFKKFQNEIYLNNDEIKGLKVKTKSFIKYIFIAKKYSEFLKKNKYDIIHINSGLILYNAIITYISKIKKMPNIIVHSHSSIEYKGLKKFFSLILKQVIDKKADYFYACSDSAAKAMFTKKRFNSKKYVIINNAIDTNLFKFNILERYKIREQLGIENNTLLIGHVGRFTDEKNHKYILKILKQIIDKNYKVKLLLIGSGPLEEKIKEFSKEYQIYNNIYFLGNINDVWKYYNAMDIFILPSKYEGLPLVAIEAQTNGLKCFLSNHITNQVNITDEIEFIDINDKSIKNWVDKIINYTEVNNRNKYYKKTINKNFDINQEAKKLTHNYLKIACR